MQTIIKLTQDLARLREEQEQSRPCHFNLLEQLRCNENSHTRILMELLKYKENGKYPLLDSFILYMLSINGLKEKLSVVNPKIDCGKNYIDGYIEDRNYAIIIENKVCNAVDQNAQIDRYVSLVSEKISSEKIFVIYLTSDGKKQVSESSYSQETQEILGNRFIEMNYRDHIISWLKELDVTDEPEIENCVELYINYLEGWFDMNRYDNKEYEEAKNEILTGLEVNRKSDGKKLSALISAHEKLDDLKETLEQSRNEYADMLLEIIKPVFESAGKALDLKCVDFPENGEELLSAYSGFGFTRAGWKKCTVRFEFDENNLKYFFFGIQQNTEDTNASKLRKALIKLISDNDEEGNTAWWPWWKKADEYGTWDESVLHEVMNDPSGLKKYVTKKLKEMLKFLDDYELEQFM